MPPMAFSGGAVSAAKAPTHYIRRNGVSYRGMCIATALWQWQPHMQPFMPLACSQCMPNCVHGRCCTGTDSGGLPALSIMFGNNDFSQTCSSGLRGVLASLPSQPGVQTFNSGFTQKTFLLQNELQECTPQLGNFTSIGFQAVSGAGSVSFCLDQIELLPPQPLGRLDVQCLKLSRESQHLDGCSTNAKLCT